MRVDVRNTGLVFTPEYAGEDEELEDFREQTAFALESAQYTASFALGVWDGKEYLVKSEGDGSWRCPVGLLEEAIETFPDARLVDKRRKPHPDTHVKIKVDIEAFRDYQREAINEIVADAGMLTGKGLIELPTGAGKTVVSAGVVEELGWPTLIIVQSDNLLRQSVRFFREKVKALSPIPKGYEPFVAQYGSGKKEIGFITIASAQALTSKNNAKSPEVRELLRTSDIVIFDECHHLEGGSRWRNILLRTNALYKVGMSATIYIDRFKGMPKGSIWMIGATGPILYEKSVSELIEAGWLCRPVIYFVSAPFPEGRFIKGAYPDVYSDGIATNAERNELIADVTDFCRENGWRTLVHVSRIEHLDKLVPKLKAIGLRVAVSHGKTGKRQRDANTKALQTRNVDCLVGTIFGEAIDLPWLEAVVIADSGKSKKAAMQKLRNLRTGSLVPILPPRVVPVFTFADFCSTTLKKHSLAQLSEYKRHRAFKIKWVRSW